MYIVLNQWNGIFVLIPYESYSTVKHIFKLVYYIYLFIYFEYKLLVGK